MKRWALIAAVVMAVGTATPTAAGGPHDVSADLEGRSIPISEVANHYCHDRNFPAIHCFETASSLRASLESSASFSPGSVTATDYVVVFSSPSYAGPYLFISQNYDTLAIVGWNDRVRSYRGLNSGQGTFWTDWFNNGASQPFCCNQTVPVLSATFDRQFSSVYRR